MTKGKTGAEGAGLDVRPVPVLRGSRVTLRPSLPEDVAAARRIGVCPEIVRLFGEEPAGEWRELTTAEAAMLIDSLGPSAGEICWVIDVGNGFIGTARLHSFDERAEVAAYAVGLLTPEVLGCGLGTEITRLVLSYAFAVLRLTAVTVRVLEFNARAIRCYARCGFRYVRRVPAAVTLEGVVHADIIMRLEAARYRQLAVEWGSKVRRAPL